MEKITDLFNRTNGTDFNDYSGETSRVHTRLAVTETWTFRVGNLQLGLPPDVMGPCT